MTIGRPRKHGVLLLPNGLTPDLHDWLKKEAAKYGLQPQTFRYRIIQAFRNDTPPDELSETLLAELADKYSR